MSHSKSTHNVVSQFYTKHRISLLGQETFCPNKKHTIHNIGYFNCIGYSVII